MEVAPFEPLGHENAAMDLIAIDSILAAEKKLRSASNPLVVVEIGSWVGQSALRWAKPGVLVYCVDHWMGNSDDNLGTIAKELGGDEVYRTFVRNTGPKLMHSIIPVVGDSEWVSSWWTVKADIVYIDAMHDYESVKADIAHWAPHVATGGLLCGHDFSWKFPGVERAVKESGEFGVISTIWMRRVGEAKLHASET